MRVLSAKPMQMTRAALAHGENRERGCRATTPGVGLRRETRRAAALHLLTCPNSLGIVTASGAAALGVVRVPQPVV